MISIWIRVWIRVWINIGMSIFSTSYVKEQLHGPYTKKIEGSWSYA